MTRSTGIPPRRAGLLALVGLLVLLPGAAYAGDAAAGRKKAAMCQTCHGIDGVGKMPDVPNIGGESATYLERQLKNFKSGERRHEQMSIVAASLSEDDIANLVAWYSSIKVTMTLPP
jgi:cytochrome c553